MPLGCLVREDINRIYKIRWVPVLFVVERMWTHGLRDNLRSVTGLFLGLR
jgi:hypothetical protein